MGVVGYGGLSWVNGREVSGMRVGCHAGTDMQVWNSVHKALLCKEGTTKYKGNLATETPVQVRFCVSCFIPSFEEHRAGSRALPNLHWIE